MMLQASIETLDQARAGRLLLAWIAGDKDAFDVNMGEVTADPNGVAGVFFAALQIAARLSLIMDPEGAEGQIVRGLLHLSEVAEGGEAA